MDSTIETGSIDSSKLTFLYHKEDMEIAEEMFQQQAGTKKKNIVHIHFNYDNWGAKSNQNLSTNLKDDRKMLDK